jgi:hypothetical protein
VTGKHGRHCKRRADTGNARCPAEPVEELTQRCAADESTEEV